MQRCILLALLLISPACAPLVPSHADNQFARGVTIVRDEWGVPTIYGPTDAAVAFGLAFAQAEDDFWQIEEDYIHALGRAASYYGEQYLAADLVKAAFEVERLSREEYQREPPQRKAIWDAFAAGLNHFVQVRGARPRVIPRFEGWMLFARFRDVGAGTIVDGVRLGQRTRASGADGATSSFTLAGVWDETALDAVLRDPQHGSTMWAVAPARAARGHALLMYSPHAFFGDAQPYELHLHSDEGWHVRGFAAIGTPVPRTGYNEHLAWGHTLSFTDAADVFEVTFDHPTDSLSYRYDGAWRRAEAWTDTLFVNTTSGVQRRAYAFRRTHHGPIAAQREGKALAVRIARFTDGGALQQWLALGRAANLDEFRAALAQAAFTGANTLYADSRGHIYYVHGNAVPARDTSFDWSRPVDGSTARTGWHGYHTLADLPQLLDPPSGWLQNTGSSPFFATAAGHNLETARFPSYMAPERDHARARAARRLLQRDAKWSFDAFAAAAFDSYVNEAESAIARLVHEWEEIGGTNPVRAMRLDEPLDRLRAWNRTSIIESTEMTLFTLWHELLSAADRDRPYSRFLAFEAVVDRLVRDWGSPFVPWGEINRLQRRHTASGEIFRDDRPSLPVRGAPGPVGVVFHFRAEPAPGSRRRYGTAPAAVGVVELAAQVHARTVVPFGQSADPASPHYFDQAVLYAGGELKPAWFARADVMAHARSVYEPGRAQTVR
jgi:acyl-homoserine-lactone acylase